MRVLIAVTEFPPGPGGIGTQAWQLARHLTENSWNVEVVAPQDYVSGAERDAFNREQKFSVVHLRHLPGAPLEALYRLAVMNRTMSRQRPDVILASGERAVWLAPAMAKLWRTPFAAVWHGVHPPTRFQLGLTRWAYGAANGVISVSEYSGGHLRDLGVQPLESVTITNGADVSFFRPIEPQAVLAFKQRLSLSSAKLLLTVGNVTERKGQDIVVRALPAILERVPNVHYLIVGLPTRRRGIEDLAESMGVASNVHFLGRADAEEVLTAYNACDVFVMTSRHSDAGYEGFGIAAVEAALCGKASIVSKNCGLAEAVEDGLTGLLVNEADPEDTARAVIRILSDPRYRAELGKEARERALRSQSWQACAEKYGDFLRAIALGAQVTSRE